METNRIWNDKVNMSSQPENRRNTVKVILDSNAFFVPLKFKIDIFKQTEELLNTKVELILLSPIRQELEELAQKGSPKLKKDASYALKIAKKCNLIELNRTASSSPDDIIIQFAKENKHPVFTNDKELKKKLRNINVPVIYVRQKTHLQIEGRI
jgi:rRNA-processing protein FCF1